MLLGIAFGSTLLLTFGLVAVLTRPTAVEKTIEKRLSGIRSTLSESTSEIGARGLFKAAGRDGSTWLHSFMVRYKLTRKIHVCILQADSSISIEALLLITGVFATVGFGIACMLLPLLPVEGVVMAAAGAVPYAYLSFKRSRRIAAFNMELPNAADMMSRALRAGHSVQGAIELLGENTAEPAASEFREIFRQQNFGLPMREALTQLLERVPSQDLRVLVTAILVQKETGGNLAEILDRTVFVIRERLRIQGEIRVQTAQGRFTGWILALLPLVMMVMLNLIHPGYTKLLLQDPLGVKLLYTGAALLAVGTMIIRRIVNGIEV